MALKNIFIYGVLALLLFITGCSVVDQPLQSESDSGVVNVMTFNIRNGYAKDGVNNWKNRRDLVVDVIRDHGADIVGLQEAFDFQVDYITGALPEYGVYYVGRADGKKSGESCAVLYDLNRYKLNDSGTFWFSETPSTPSAHWGNMYNRICSWVRLVNKTDGKGIYAYNLHLDHISQDSREKSTKLLTKKISDRKYKNPYIVMGDFNMHKGNPGMKYLLKPNIHNRYPLLSSAWHAANPRENELKTGHGYKGGTFGSAIDYILVEKGTSVLKADVDQRLINGKYPSDHYPVTAAVKLY